MGGVHQKHGARRGMGLDGDQFDILTQMAEDNGGGVPYIDDHTHCDEVYFTRVNYKDKAGLVAQYHTDLDAQVKMPKPDRNIMLEELFWEIDKELFWEERADYFDH